ncbi:hypothetical protein [Escherichia coli]|nr:hypothetical protein [Escherichia coli]
MAGGALLVVGAQWQKKRKNKHRMKWIQDIKKEKKQKKTEK